MAITLLSNMTQDPLNTVAVVPYDLERTTSRTGASGPRTQPRNALAVAASNLISAIAQGSTANDTVVIPEIDNLSDAGCDEGPSSFTYAALNNDNVEADQRGWYASTTYHISNRYYDVDITLKATKAALSAPRQPSEISTSPTESVLSHPFPAYLVVVDRSQPLEHHRHLASSLESKVTAGFDADISIVAGVSLLSSSHPQLVTALDDEPRSSASARETTTKAKTSDLVALYADFGWEFIAIDDLDAEDERGIGSENGDSYSDGEGEDDTDGIERIREALMNHMWNGLVRKDQDSGSASRHLASRDTAFGMSFHQGFSDSMEDRDEADGDQDATPSRAEAIPSCSNNDSNLGTKLPSISLDIHVEATGLDEQLAKLFLSSSDGKDLADLEAFLESEDPSWPASQPRTATQADKTDDAPAQFDDDFDGFLPFQSAPSQPSALATGAEDAEELPSMDEVSQMQDRLFGSNAASRLEAGPLGMSSGGSVAGQDLASQLQQLQWHAERVRSIQDPDQRRKEAALVALAFSMHWENEGEGELGGDGAMAF